MRENYVYLSGSSKTQLTKTFYTSIRIQAIEKLNFVWRGGYYCLPSTLSQYTQNQSLYFEF